MKKILYTFAVVAAMFAFSSCQEKIDDPGKKDKDQTENTDDKGYTVDQYGYATYTHQGFEFKVKAGLITTTDAQKAIQHMRDDLDFIAENFPENALKILRKHPIWMEENNTRNPSAAWCHVNADYPASYGESYKGHCVEITNYKNYVAWSNQNQPLMVLHELGHLYHALGLGGESNVTIKNAYKNALDKDLYKVYYYRSTLADKKGTKYTASADYKTNPNAQKCYCTNTMWEYFSEMTEAYFGENDYYPFNYAQLKEHDPMAFEMCEKIWGARP